MKSPHLTIVSVLALFVFAFLFTAPVVGEDDPAGPADGDVVDPPIATPLNILIYSRTAGYRHKSIEDGVKMINDLAALYGYTVEHTELPTEFNDEKLAQFDVVVFLSTSGDVLDDTQQLAFEKYIRNGGGYVGIHGASATEYDWPWYGKLVGAVFTKHPAIQEATINITSPQHICMHDVPNPWVRTDEWYNFKDVQTGLTMLATVDESTYEGGEMGENHPLIWCHEFDGGRSFYTAIGHTKESFSEPAFISHVHRGILWAAGRSMPVPPDSNEN